MHFRYAEAFHKEPMPDAYETLLLDVMQGEQTLFMRADQVEAAWNVVMPLLEAWEASDEPPLLYSQGSLGPQAASHLVEQDGGGWYPESEEVIGERMSHVHS